MKNTIEILRKELENIKSGKGYYLDICERTVDDFENILWLSDEINKEHAKIKTIIEIVPAEY